jgi:hypothetical protein
LASGVTVVIHAGGERLGIVELVEVSARERARALALFEHLGTWVATTAHPPLQRLFATAAHRHAWHAQLWADRSPLIPVPPLVVDIAAIVEAGDDADRWTAYATALGTLIVELGALRDRIDPELDPGTARVIELVGADANRLASLVAATPSV